jgi:hypothetical protein
MGSADFMPGLRSLLLTFPSRHRPLEIRFTVATVFGASAQAGIHRLRAEHVRYTCGFRAKITLAKVVAQFLLKKALSF